MADVKPTVHIDDKVTLQHNEGGGDTVTQEFDFDHAERILQIKTPPRVWSLPKDSPYQFKNNKLSKIGKP